MNTLDNRDENLRIATVSQNRCNRRATLKNTSGFKGVTWDKDHSKWRAEIRVERKLKYLGLYNTPEAAFAAYCVAAQQMHGDFARSK
jgi:hypothetical protein